MTFGTSPINSKDNGLADIQTNFDVANTAQHDTAGSQMIYDPRKRKPIEHDTAVSTLDIAPSIPKYLGISTSDYMTGVAVAKHS